MIGLGSLEDIHRLALALRGIALSKILFILCHVLFTVMNRGIRWERSLTGKFKSCKVNTQLGLCLQNQAILNTAPVTRDPV